MLLFTKTNIFHLTNENLQNPPRIFAVSTEQLTLITYSYWSNSALQHQNTQTY